MKALSLTQPWASLVAVHAKSIETRSWSTPYRGEIAIHAAKGFPRDAIECCFVEPFRSALRDAGIVTPNDLPRGAIVAVAELVDCWPTESLKWLLPHAILNPRQEWIDTDTQVEREFGDFSNGRYAWVVRNVRRLAEPIPVKGSLGLWDVPPDVADAIARQLAVAS